VNRPALSRRHAAGAESARGLLFTVLGEFVLPGGGSAWTSTIIDVLGRLDVEEKASRQALMRTASDGWLRSERIGRRTRWWLTDAGEIMLTEGSARIYGFSGEVDDWDGRWLLVLARVPETERPARHRLRTRLAWAGLGTPSPGVWLSTHADRLPEAERALADAGVLDDAQIFFATYATGQLDRMVRQAWDLTAIESDYQQFIDEFSTDVGEDALGRLIELVHAWRRFPWTDPALPSQLLPTPWSGASAAELFARRREEWGPSAREQWRLLDT
jgi:phenylacetic acid degradation operon negative regulatory protein